MAAAQAYPTPLPTPPNGPRPAAYTALASSRAVIDGQVTPATILVSHESGKIIDVWLEIVPPARLPPSTDYIDHSPHVLLPGLVDAHVHLNEPGRTEWEGFETGTKAAAFGGVTTVIDMPLNAIPPTTTVSHLEEKIAAAQGKCHVDVGFYGGVIPGNAGELLGLVQRGVRGFKGFLIDSGVPEFPAVSEKDIALAMATLAHAPTTLMFHAEALPDTPIAVPSANPTAYSTFLASRPQLFETHAISQILALAPTAPQLHLHIVHLSATDAIPLLRQARHRGINITSETCPHYLSLAAEDIADGDTRHKCCPPIREASNRARLWAELCRPDSVIQTIVSDHSPCTPALKLLPAGIPPSEVQPGQPDPNALARGDFFTAWGGISSVGLTLPLLWTAAAQHGISLAQIVQWTCVATAQQVGLARRKGRLAAGWDADVAVFDTEGEWVVEPSRMLFRNRCSAYEGKRLRGVVRETWVRGRRVWDGKTVVGPRGWGALLLDVRA